MGVGERALFMRRENGNSCM